MGLLRYGDDEVADFHPVFEQCATAALAALGLTETLTWVHHPLTAVGVPDFVLVEKKTNRWVLVMEIKRRPGAVFAARSQAQAKLYAEDGQQRYRPGHPEYFAVTNLEVGVLLALNGGRPPSECQVAGGVATIASFAGDSVDLHRSRLSEYLARLVTRVWTSRREMFDVEWPRVVGIWVKEAGAHEGPANPPLPEPRSPEWPALREYFALPGAEAEGQIVLLHALLAAFLRGRLTAEGHPQAGTVRPADTRQRVARAIEALRAIDFESVFDDDAAARFAAGTSQATQALDRFAGLLASTPRLDQLAHDRQDHQLFLEELLLSVYPVKTRADRGKVQTDLELAQVLASLSIPGPGQILDPCCGEGNLLVAAVDRLEALGVGPGDAVRTVQGIEIDGLSALIAGTRLALRAGRQLDVGHQPRVRHEDMFISASDVRAADVILMNPPFLRYEDQRRRSLPEKVRSHFARAISQVGSGAAPEALGTQPNLFQYFVEYVIRTASPGTRLGFVLDNKWFQNKTGGPLKSLIKRTVRLEALVEYPHRAFFRDWDVATTLLIGVRDDSPPSSHVVKFVRATVDPRGVSLEALSSALRSGGRWPTDWKAQRVRQADLQPKAGWKREFAASPPIDFEALQLPTLRSLFDRSRRGSLDKEGGGTAAFAFPFSGRPLRYRRRLGGTPPYGTAESRRLTPDEEAELAAAAAAIPPEFRGYGLRNSDTLRAYRLTAGDVECDQTLEPPALRANPTLFRGDRRSRWTAQHDDAISEIRRFARTRRYLDSVERIVGLTENLLADKYRFVDLREPYAGELIIPRKMRASHRVHVNPFAFVPSERQVRISSNFVTYGDCVASDLSSGLGRECATELIAAFLVSSFGQLQFEMMGRNREGLLSIEKDEIDNIRVVDPRGLPAELRRAILAAFRALPFPVSATVLSANQPRSVLDDLWAGVLAPRIPCVPSTLLREVHDAVDEWIDARQP